MMDARSFCGEGRAGGAAAGHAKTERTACLKATEHALSFSAQCLKTAVIN